MSFYGLLDATQGTKRESGTLILTHVKSSPSFCLSSLGPLNHVFILILFVRAMAASC